MPNPFFSVIIPTYNRAHLVGETIESVLAQTFKDFELIIVDDGSTDNTKEVVSKYLSDPRVKYIYQENKERAAARNNGIKNSNGKWMAFLDSDDLLLPNHLEACSNRIHQINEPALVYSLSYIADKKGNIITKQRKKILEGHVLEKIVIQGHAGFANSSSCVHKSIFYDVGFLNENKHLSGSEDTELWIRIASKYSFYSTGKYTVKLRGHEGQTMIDSVKMEQCLKKMHEIIFSNTDLQIIHLKNGASANLNILISINYYSIGKMRVARNYLYNAVKNKRIVLSYKLWWWTFFRSLFPIIVINKLRKLKYHIYGFFLN